MRFFLKKTLNPKLIIENHTMCDFVKYMDKNRNEIPEQLIHMYKQKRKFPDMRDFRLGPHMINKIPLDWIIFRENKNLIGHGMMTCIFWDGDINTIPDGWQGTVCRSYENSVVEKKEYNTLAGMFIRIEPDYRKQGGAGVIINEMKALGKKRGLSSLIIPLRLPQRYQKEYAEMPYEEFAFLKREDGQYEDHWLRLHVNLGAKILGVCHISHQHAMNLKDFYKQFDVPSLSIAKSGYHLIKQTDEWYRVYVDVEREFVLINQGCVWVQHILN